MKEYEVTGAFVNMSEYEKKLDSKFEFWHKLEMSMLRLLILVYIKNVDHNSHFSKEYRLILK